MIETEEFITIFGTDHLIYIAGLIVCLVLLLTNVDRIRGNRETITKSLIVINILQQIILYGSYFVYYDFTFSESLPLHISRISSILGIIFLITKNEKIYKIHTSFSLFAWLSFFYPSRVHGVTHPIGLSFFINHAMTILLPFYGMIAYDMRIKWNNRNYAMKWFLVYLIGVMIINPLVDGNYFYLKYRPLPFLQDWPYWIYIVTVIIVTYILFTIGEFIYLKLQQILLERLQLDKRVSFSKTSKESA